MKSIELNNIMSYDFSITGRELSNEISSELHIDLYNEIDNILFSEIDNNFRELNTILKIELHL